jgi:hypothetical protein
LQTEARQVPSHFSLIDLTFELQAVNSITMLVRDVDKLDPLPDEKLRQLDEEYVVSITTAHMRNMLLSNCMRSNRMQFALRTLCGSLTSY